MTSSRRGWDFLVIQGICNAGSQHSSPSSRRPVKPTRYPGACAYQSISNVTAVVPFLQMIRNARDCLEHRNPIGATASDFTLHADGKIGMPSIEIDFRGSVVERCSISAFMVGDVKTLLGSFEMITLHMWAKNILPFAGMPMTIAPLSDDYKRAWRVRFAYGCYYADGQFTPCG